MKYSNIFFIVFFAFAFSVNAQVQGGKNYQQTLWIVGNSLLAYNEGSTVRMGQFVAHSVYDSVRQGKALRVNCLDSNSRTDLYIKNVIPTRIAPFIKPKDIFVYSEVVNSVFNSGLSADSCFGYIKEFSAMVNAAGAKLIVCTVTASDRSGDPASGLDTIFRYNSLVRTNAAMYNYTVCDIAADPHFDERSDCSNTTYYKTDKLHLVSAGQMLMINYIVETVRALL